MERFKLDCSNKGWKVHEHEDLVYAMNQYHHFIWARHVFPRTFRKVVENCLVPVREGDSYRIVDAAYTAWVTWVPIEEKIKDAFLEAPSLSRRVAVYDMSPVYRGEGVCSRINKTESVVFREFEKFLCKEFKLRFEPLNISTNKSVVAP